MRANFQDEIIISHKISQSFMIWTGIAASGYASVIVYDVSIPCIFEFYIYIVNLGMFLTLLKTNFVSSIFSFVIDIHMRITVLGDALYLCKYLCN